jgi:hypothetical protein
MDVDGYGWFGKVKEGRSLEWTYGPTINLKIAKEAVERYLRGRSTSEDWDLAEYGSIYVDPTSATLSQYRVSPELA